MGIIAARSAGQNQAFAKNKVLAGRNFCNKLWNISRFVQDKVGEIKSSRPPEAYSLADHWIIRELASAQKEIDQNMAAYRFSEASELVYHTIWSSVADWYIEASKTQENDELLVWVLESCLKIAHPFVPFVTETIWQTLPWTEGILANEKFAESLEFDEYSASEFERVQKLVGEIRFVTASLPGNKRYGLIYADDQLIDSNTELIKHLARLPQIEKTDAPRGVNLAASGRGAWLDVPAKVLSEHKANLEIRIHEARQEIQKLEGRLGNKNYTEKAPAHLVEETRIELNEKKSQVEKLEREMENL